jgi:glycosyltransferase involved in cell wall biosynthesis
VVHAVEESAFMALLVCPFSSTPYIYDMDSSMTTQLVDQMHYLRPFRKILRFMESLPVRYAEAVVPMCDALADEARRYRSRNIVVLKDVSLIKHDAEPEEVSDIRQELGLPGKVVMYIGNLEKYQGVDLLLESFSIVKGSCADVSLIIIGGNDQDIQHYRNLAGQSGIGDSVHFLGPKPVEHIGQYMAQADILVSPRTHGANTPMKVYSYLDSGVAVLATRLPTHTQVMNEAISMLAAPEKVDYAEAMLALLTDDEMRKRLAKKAKDYIKREHSYAHFKDLVFDLYSRMDKTES